MKLIEIEKRKLDNQYLQERDTFWEVKIKKYNQLGKPLWNGSVYYLDNQKDDNLYIGLCEYKDIVFLEEKGDQYIVKKYGQEHVFIYLNVQILINHKDLYLFGTKQLGNTKEIISVGGTLRLEDDEKIQSFENVIEYAKKEVDIETKLNIKKKDLKFINFFVNENIGTFVFQYNLENKNDYQVLNIGEFDGEIYLNKEDVYNSSNFTPNIRLKSIKNFLQNLWKIR